ncbi:claudin-34 [Pteronotus mesoamericanus]|uniref:claudin-34 n=1 Tax=Pteronotus mesoamericanus TaxID=1884717 RepID=UPI0023ED9D2C|nr:claudin-34 [Pteronotus parnellii mesoamericanus]
MGLHIPTARLQMGGFAVATVGWIFCMTSMGLAEWRVWYVRRSPPLPPGLVCVGMWKVCIYQPSSYSQKDIACHLYRYADPSLPVDIRVAQSLLLAASVLGLLGKAFLVLALRRVCVGSLRKESTRRLFLAAGVQLVSASACISVAVVCNASAVGKAAGVAFPPSFALPFQPETQEVGGASIVATLAVSLMLLSGLLSLSYTLPPESQVHPVISEV